MSTLSIPWADDYAIGDEEIDRQHHELFELAYQVIRVADKRELTALVMKLYQHVRQHFSHEEELMRRLAYPAYQQHLEVHNRMIGQLNTMAADVAADRWSSQSLHGFMVDWVAGHIHEHDSRLAAYVRLKE